jgi:hypothetical protein
MTSLSMPFKRGHQVKEGGESFKVEHVDFGTDRVQLSNEETKVRENRSLTELFSALANGAIQVLDSYGILIDGSPYRVDVATLSPKKHERYVQRVDYAKRLDELGRVGPSSAAFLKTLEALNKSWRSDVKPWAAYGWLLRYRAQGSFSALALPRRSSSSPLAPITRMHPLVRKALDEVLS